MVAGGSCQREVESRVQGLELEGLVPPPQVKTCPTFSTSEQWVFIVIKRSNGDFPGGPMAKTLRSQGRGPPGSIPGQGPRSHMLQLRPGAAK